MSILSLVGIESKSILLRNFYGDLRLGNLRETDTVAGLATQKVWRQMFKWYVMLVVLLEVVALAALGLWQTGAPVLLLSLIVPVTIMVAVLWRVRSAGSFYKIRRLLPEDITSYEGADPIVPSPQSLSRSIVERANEIRKILRSESKPSEIRIEMCAMGYRACVNDMITLSHLINEELSNANFARRVILRRARRKATEALSGAREALPPGALRATHQEQQ